MLAIVSLCGAVSQTLTLVISILKLVSAKDKKGIVSQSELIAHYDQLCLMLGTLLHKVRSTFPLVSLVVNGQLSQAKP